MRTTCTECGGPEYARGLCAKHYQHARYHGELPAPPSRQCEHCGQVFTSKYRNAMYCSSSCKDSATAQRRRAEALAAAGDRRCLECSTPIPASVTLKAKCCSRECGVAYQNRIRAEAKRATWAAEGLRCEQCGGPIPVPTSGRRRTKYCSQACKKKAKDAEWRIKSPHYMRQYMYGLTPERYEAMLAEQDSRCAICGSPDWPAPIKSGSPQVDHDHECDQGHAPNRACACCARGLLCGHCNTGIGHLGHDPARLRAAADYLDKHR